MLVLLVIVILAVLALWASNMERKPPAILVAMGVLSVILGGRAVALVSDSYSDAYLSVTYADEEQPANEQAVTEIEVTDVPNNELIPKTSVANDETPSVEATAEVRELTIEPTPSFRYLTLPRPDWVETEALTTEDCYQISVDSGLQVRKRTAQQSLRDEVKANVDGFVKDYLGSELAATLSGYSIDESQRGDTRTFTLRLDNKQFEIANQRFDEQVEFDYGVMNQSHALVKIDKNLQNALDERWSKVRATSRLFQTGLGAGAVLLLLGTMFSYLKLDTATRGYYTGRLQFGAAAAILAVIAAGVVCANWIPWM
ncbi:MAG: hypothetical protein H8E66_27575 [Planctomycetes bacterium]|nr:hypothetical protein [Planctomycetota bacterium]